MFKSKIRDIVITQHEHARLAALIASLWGNDQFDRPTLNFTSFLQGVMFHDRGYGILDNAPINEAPLETWLDIQRKSIEGWDDDASADILIQMHVQRLLAFDDTPQRQHLSQQAEERILQRLNDSPYSRDQHGWAARITAFCDKISFDFCFEAPIEFTFKLNPHADNFDTVIEVTHRIEPGGRIIIAPWPLRVPEYEGFIISYQAAGYPEQLHPVLCPFHITPA